MINQGLNFMADGGISHPKFRILVKKNREGRTLLSYKILGFLEIFAFMKQNPVSGKNLQFLCNAGQFLSVRGNFLLLIRDDSFLIL